MRPRASWLAAVFALALSAAPAAGAPTYPPLSGRVVDQANALPAATERALSSKLEKLERDTGHQFVVATTPSLQGYEIEQYSLGLARAWGVGRAAYDDGVLLLVAPTERSVRVEVGDGLERVLTNETSHAILQERVLPRFAAGDLAGGVVSGTDAIIEVLVLSQARRIPISPPTKR